jgi:tRNA(Arg) A34 adenosine deaminase TadA
VRLASRKYSTDQMASFTMYASAEPCAMCAGAIHWSHVGRLVFALSEVDLYEIAGPSPEHLILSCREVFQHSSQAIDVSGPCQELDKEARAVLAGFWTK